MDNLAITHIRYGDGYEYKRVCTYPSPSPIKARIPCQSQGGAVPVGVYIYRERERHTHTQIFKKKRLYHYTICISDPKLLVLSPNECKNQSMPGNYCNKNPIVT